MLAVLLPTSDQTGLEGLPLRVLPSFSSYCLRLAMAAPYPKLPPAYPNEGEDQGIYLSPLPHPLHQPIRAVEISGWIQVTV